MKIRSRIAPTGSREGFLAIDAQKRRPERSRTRLGCPLDAPWGALGSSRGAPGRPPGALGALLARPGRVPEGPGASPKRLGTLRTLPDRFLSDFGSILGVPGRSPEHSRSVLSASFLDRSPSFPRSIRLRRHLANATRSWLCATRLRLWSLTLGALAASLRRGCARATDSLHVFVCGRTAHLATPSTSPFSIAPRYGLCKCT